MSGERVTGKRSRGAVAVVLAASLVLAGVTRYGAMAYRAKTVPTGTQAVTEESSSARLSTMPSFATALLLGGLRGPLVMLLWTSSESQKADKNLEDFDTKVEWIRLLQPEFDSVHIFQIWNKAYNISVQMASLANKYATILDALDYAQRMRVERPNNINLEVATADIYANKLGGATEKDYYRRRVMEDTRWRVVAGVRPGEMGWRRTRLDPMLDEGGKILPGYRTELRYLTQYEPFPEGLDPFALGYNYYRRSQELERAGQSHLQLSNSVLDSRSALTMRSWSEENIAEGRKLELEMYGEAVPTERLDMELPTAGVGLDQKMARPGNLAEAIRKYHWGERLAEDSIKLYEDHLRDYGAEYSTISTFASHLDHMRIMRALSAGDEAFLLAAQAKAGTPERTKQIAAARDAYREAAYWSERVELAYYTDTELLNMLKLTKQQVATLQPGVMHAAMIAMREITAKMGVPPTEERAEYDEYFNRASRRLGVLGR